MLAKIARTISIVLVVLGMAALISFQEADFCYYLIALAVMIAGGVGYKLSSYLK